MKNSFKMAAVAAAGAVGALAFGAIVSEGIQVHGGQHHGGQHHGGQAHAHQMLMKLELSGFQMALTHMVEREYSMLLDGAASDAKKKQIHASQHETMLRLLTPAQQEKALKEILAKHPEAKDHAKPTASMVRSLAVATDAQKEQLKAMHEMIQSHMKGMSEEEIAAIHSGKGGAEVEAHLKAMVDEIRNMLSADQKKEWDAVLAYVAAEKNRLK